MIRTTTSMTQRSILKNIQDNYARMSLFQNQTSSGKRILSPSDDPVGTYKSFRLSEDIAKLQQYNKNIDVAYDEMNLAGEVLNNTINRITDVKKIIVQAARGTIQASELQSLGSEVEEIIKQLVSYGNSAVNGKYMFAGAQTNTKPFIANMVAGLVNSVTYNGDVGQRTVEIADGRTVTMNTVGDNTGVPPVPTPPTAVFADQNLPTVPVGIFNILIQLRDDLIAATPASITQMRTTDQGNVGKYFDFVTNIAGRNGAQIAELQSFKSAQEQEILVKKSQKADVEEVDMTQAISDYSNSTTIYKAALQMGAALNQFSLFDFLR